MDSLIALVALMLWPAAPVFLLLLHLGVGFWRRVGVLSYAVFVLAWLFVAALVYSNRSLVLGYAFDFGAVSYLGLLPLAFGMLLQFWASSIIGWKGTLGWYELFPKKDGAFRVEGPYRYVRHPIYLAHTSMLAGVFLMTGVPGAGVAALADFALSYFMITRIEEKELRDRFGKEYSDYAERVPRFFPGWK